MLCMANWLVWESGVLVLAGSVLSAMVAAGSVRLPARMIRDLSLSVKATRIWKTWVLKLWID